MGVVSISVQAGINAAGGAENSGSQAGALFILATGETQGRGVSGAAETGVVAAVLVLGAGVGHCLGGERHPDGAACHQSQRKTPAHMHLPARLWRSSTGLCPAARQNRAGIAARHILPRQNTGVDFFPANFRRDRRTTSPPPAPENLYLVLGGRHEKTCQ